MKLCATYHPRASHLDLEHPNHIQCGGFKICPQILWYTFLWKVDTNLPPFMYGLDLMMLLIGRIWWKQRFMNSETNLLNFNPASPKFEHRILFFPPQNIHQHTLENATLYSQRIMECQQLFCPEPSISRWRNPGPKETVTVSVLFVCWYVVYSLIQALRVL